MNLTKQDVVDVFNRVGNFAQRHLSADDVCSRLNAEFHASFYSNKADVWMNYTREGGVPYTQRIGTFQ